MAGNMGVEEEIIDADYPTFLVHVDTRAKMKRTYYENPGDQQWMLSITETQNQMTIQENIEVQDPAEPESMMSLSLESRTSAIHEVAERLDEVDINTFYFKSGTGLSHADAPFLLVSSSY